VCSMYDKNSHVNSRWIFFSIFELEFSIVENHFEGEEANESRFTDEIFTKDLWEFFRKKDFLSTHS
jgi:hypothetical protein